MTIHPGQRRLSRVQVVNWGTFSGHHDMPVARKGFLLTGSSGSGKSTLIDAISAVLMPGGSVKFNAAAQSLDKSGRSLVSYMRGAWRREASTETDGLTSTYLRADATWSGVALTYSAGAEGDAVTLVKLMHLARGANSYGDITHLHVLADGDITLTDFEPFVSRGIDKRGVDKRWPDAASTRDYAVFARAFRKRLGIGSESAQKLLHRTLSAKSLGSLDQLFRDYMLDAPDTFAKADRAVEQFRDLREAHRLVVDARRQVETLSPLPELASSRAQATTTAGEVAEEDEHLESVHAKLTLALLRENETELQASRPLLFSASMDAQARRARARDATMDLKLSLAKADGGRLDALHTGRNAAIDALSGTNQRHGQVANAVGQWHGQMATTAEEYTHLRAQIEAELRQLDGERADRLGRQHAVYSERAESAKARAAVIADRELLAAGRSNLDPLLLRARGQICRATGIGEDELPFAGELMQVHDAPWTGPIERVLGGFGRTLLVPQALYPRVAEAVDREHLGARLVYLRVNPDRRGEVRESGSDSMIRKVEVRPGPLARWLHQHLSERFDYTCVESAAQLAGHRSAVTRAGQVKHADRFEKDDRRRIDDRSRWVLGFDNETKLADLRIAEAECDNMIERLTRQLDELGAKDRQLDGLRSAAQTIRDRDWADIDVEAGRLEVQGFEDRLARWSRDNPEHAALSRQLEEAEHAERDATEAQTRAATALAGLERDLAKVVERIEELNRMNLGAVPELVHARITARFGKAARKVTADNVDRILASVRKDLGEDQKRAQQEISQAERKITGVLTRYLAGWQHARAELREEAEYVDDALAVLARLRGDNLPEFEDRFFEMLSTQSIQNLGDLSRTIKRASKHIRDRIDPVNESLSRSAFDTGRVLRIDVRDRRGPAAAQFLTDLSATTSGAFSAEDRGESERRFESMAALLDRLGSGEPADQRWRTQVLDTRLHVSFIGVEVDEDGHDVNFHDSSSGLSGGQAQKLVFFCLAAALRYQLSAAGDELPRYGTVILDEAFDRADAAYTRRALDVFALFGFHMVLATPLKLLSTLEEYIGGAAAVHIEDSRSSRLSKVPFK